jgi:hypothetical protein
MVAGSDNDGQVVAPLRGVLFAGDFPFTVFAAASRPLLPRDGDDTDVLDALWSDYMDDKYSGVERRRDEGPTLMPALIEQWQRRRRFGDDAEDGGRVSNFARLMQRQPPTTIRLDDDSTWHRFTLHFASYHAARFALRRLASWYAASYPPRALKQLGCRLVALLPPKLAEHAWSQVVPVFEGVEAHFYDAYLLAQLPTVAPTTWPLAVEEPPGAIAHPVAKVMGVGTRAAHTAFADPVNRERTTHVLVEMMHKKPLKLSHEAAHAWLTKVPATTLARTLGTDESYVVAQWDRAESPSAATLPDLARRTPAVKRPAPPSTEGAEAKQPRLVRAPSMNLLDYMRRAAAPKQ